MGLEDFTSDGNSSSSTSSKNSESEADSSEEPDSDISFYGDDVNDSEPDYLEREGPINPSNMADLAKVSEGKITSEQDHVKFHCPIFQIIERQEEYEVGRRYMMKYDGDMNSTSWHGRVVTCLGAFTTTLGKLTKEQAMFDAGTNDRNKAIKILEERLNGEVGSETEVVIHFFGDTLHLRDLAQANEVYKGGERIDRDRISKFILSPRAMESDMERLQEND